ncbi:MAG: sulfotransferase domain-containing protein, partial [Planctomycetaceae bacterium]|nr:sulfotransferase domain-containing protein [Planctomycetaceae bacterium]
MDVLCVGMYRACSTWQYEVIAHLLERHRDGQRLGYVSGAQYDELARRGRSRPGWRVLKSHEGHRGFAKALAEGRAMAIYGYRDIRDVVFSLMHKRGATFEQLLRQGMIHQILVNDRYWSKRPCVLTQRYEVMITDPVAGVMELASALDLAISDAEAAEVAAEYSFQT